MARERAERPQRRHRPDELGPRLFKRGRWWAADLRPWADQGLPDRPTLRDPQAPGWPDAGDRTEGAEIARAWAEAYVAVYRDERRRKHLGLARRPEALDAAVRKFLDQRRLRVAHNTWSATRTACRHLLEYAGATRSTGDVTAALLQEMFEDLVRLGYAASTLETLRNGLSTFCEYLGHGALNAARAVELPDPGEPDPRAWSDDELEELRKAADKVDFVRRGRAPSARFALETGVGMGPRQQELFALEFERINPRKRGIRIYRQLLKDGHGFTLLKGKAARTAFILPFWWDYFEPGRRGLVLCNADGSVIGGRSRIQRELIQRVYDTAGLNAPGLGWHTLRHTYARLCLERYEISLAQLQLFLGHKSIAVTQKRYGHYSEESALENARARVYGEGEGRGAVRLLQ